MNADIIPDKLWSTDSAAEKF